MRPNILSKRTLIIAALFGLVFFAVLFFSLPANSTRDDSKMIAEDAAALPNQEQATQKDVSFGSPASLKIPAIHVDTNVIPVGLTSDGAMDVPDGPDEVAWFDLRERPGEDGTAVMTGHYGWKNNIPAVFDDLHKLEVGDKILAEDENGKTATFVVRETRIYDKDATAPEVFDSSDGKAHLNLITCTGDWNSGEETFSERLVVFTDKEQEKD